jgi:hypothetical protein
MEDGMSRACSVHGEKCADSILIGKPEEMEHWKNLNVDGKIIMEWTLEK